MDAGVGMVVGLGLGVKVSYISDYSGGQGHNEERHNEASVVTSRPSLSPASERALEALASLASFKIGDEVIVVGLTSNTQFNGRRAFIVGYQAAVLQVTYMCMIHT